MVLSKDILDMSNCLPVMSFCLLFIPWIILQWWLTLLEMPIIICILQPDLGIIAFHEHVINLWEFLPKLYTSLACPLNYEIWMFDVYKSYGLVHFFRFEQICKTGTFSNSESICAGFAVLIPPTQPQGHHQAISPRTCQYSRIIKS